MSDQLVTLQGFKTNFAMLTSVLRTANGLAFREEVVKVESWLRWVSSGGGGAVTTAHVAHLLGPAAADCAKALVRRTYTGACTRNVKKSVI